MMLLEFDRFLVELAGLSVSDDVKRIANIILKHTEELVSLGTAQAEFVETVPEITVTTEPNQEYEFAIKRLKSIDIKSFSGFTQKEKFDLDAPIVLLYGPNGTGKSSFCEAL